MDALAKAVRSAITAVKAAIPSQSPSVSVEGVRKTASGTRPVRGLLSVVILASGMADRILDVSLGSNLRAVKMLVPKSGDGAWFDVSDPQLGDVFTFDNGSRYSLYSVEDIRGVYFKIGARQC